MRTLTMFALALAGTAMFTSDASAFGKRRGGAGCSGGGGCSGYSYGGGVGYAAPVGYGCSGSAWSGGVMTYPGASAAYSGTAGTSIGSAWSTTNGGKATVVQATDGQYYTLGADGYYYASTGIPNGTSGITTLGGFYPGGRSYRGSSYYPSGMYPAGYSGSYYPGGYYNPSVVPAGGTAPLTMPGITVGPGGITIVPGTMPPVRRP